MRVNIYAEEMTDKIEIIEKTTPDGIFTGVRFYLELPVTYQPKYDIDKQPMQIRGPFMHHPGDNDSAAVTFWGKKDLRAALEKALELLTQHEDSKRSE